MGLFSFYLKTLFHLFSCQPYFLSFFKKSSLRSVSIFPRVFFSLLTLVFALIGRLFSLLLLSVLYGRHEGVTLPELRPTFSLGFGSLPQLCPSEGPQTPYKQHLYNLIYCISSLLLFLDSSISYLLSLVV